MAGREPDEVIIKRIKRAVIEKIGVPDDALAGSIARAALAAIGSGAGRDTVIEEIRDGLSLRLNNHLIEMKEGYDDSIVGFNEAWSIVSDYLRALAGPTPPTRKEVVPSDSRNTGPADATTPRSLEAGATPPAASDLRERATVDLVRAIEFYLTRCDDADDYRECERLVAEHDAAIRAEAEAEQHQHLTCSYCVRMREEVWAEAKAEGWDDAEKALCEAGLPAGANWLATNRPSLTDRSE